MKKSFVLLFVFHFSLIFGQSKRISGSYILDYVTYKNGNLLEVNHPLFSVFMEYEFKGNKLIIDDAIFDVNIYESQIITQLRTINYQVQDDKLFLSDKGDDKVFVFIKRDKFLKHYPEFEPTQTTFENQEVYIPNNVVKADFEHPLKYHIYLIDNTPLLNNSSYYGKIIVNFILTNDNKIKQLTFNDGLTKKITEQLKNTVYSSEKFFNNTTGKDLLMTIYVELKKYRESSKIENNFFKLRNKADDYYLKNDFKNAIAAYETVIEYGLKFNDEKNNFNLHKLYLDLGKSYLADNKIEKACECFKTIGGERNFDSRNYFIYFCK